MKFEIEISEDTLEYFKAEWSDVYEREPTMEDIRVWVEAYVEHEMKEDWIWQTFRPETQQ